MQQESKTRPGVTHVGRRVAMVLSVLLLAFGFRVLASARSELADGLSAEARGDVPAALMHYRRAAAFRVPGSPFHVQALDRLEVLALLAERAGRNEASLAFYRAARAALLSSRGLLDWDGERRRRVDGRIAALMAGEKPAPLYGDKAAEARRAEYGAALSATPGPKPGHIALAFAGLVAAVLGALGLAYRGVGTVQEKGRGALLYGVLALFGICLAALGCALA